jgi:hypothetical protein
MDEKPKRRWFHFRLNTWLVLFALLPAYAGGVIKFVSTIAVGGSSNISRGPIDDGYPFYALAAFLAWKAAWAVVERRRRLSGAPE